MPFTARIITHNGDSRPLPEWAKLTGIPAQTIRERLNSLGWTVERALTEPVASKFSTGRKRIPGGPPLIPELKRHTTGSAFVKWKRHGREHSVYFGVWGTPEAAKKYAKFAAEWVEGGYDDLPANATISIAELCLKYLDHAEAYYRKNGRRTSQYHQTAAAIDYLSEIYNEEEVDEFRPRCLRVVVSAMIAKNLSRSTVNAYQGCIIRMFRWGVGQELVHPDTFARLDAVESQQSGRSDAPDMPKKRSVPSEHITGIAQHLHQDAETRRVLSDMIRLQEILGLRPGELVRITPQSIEQNHGDLWLYRDEEHKQQHTGAGRSVWIGPRAQKILRPYLEASEPSERVFRFSTESRGAGRPITVSAYHDAVKRACIRAGIPHWHPHRLRHNRATEVRRRYESDAAAAAAIGDTPDVAAAVYTDDPGEGVAKRIAREIG